MTQPRMALPAILERLAFAFLILLALTFPLEIPLGSQLVAFTNLEVLEILVVSCWILSHIISKTLPRLPRKLVLPVVLWLAVLTISTLLAPDALSHTIRFMSRIIQGLLLAWIAYDLVDNSLRWQMLIKTLVVAGVVVALLGLAEAANVSPVVTLLTLFRASQTHVGDIIRVSSSLEYATVAAMVLEMLIPLTLAWAVTTNQRWLRFGLIIVILINVATLVLTLTRSAILGLVVALIAIAGISFWKRQRLVATAAVGTLLATAGTIVILLITNPPVGLRLLSESENGWYQARYVVPAELTARPNEWLTVPVQITNTGQRGWQSSATLPFRLGYTLIHTNDSKAKGLDGIRTELPANVAPGQSVSVQAQVPAPETTGKYLIQWDMVEETILWFSWRGSPLGSTMLTVDGAPVPNVQRPKLSPANHSMDAPPVERSVLWRAALKMFREKPLFGVGPDNFRWIYGHYLGFDHWDTNVHANSIYFESLADTGLLGLLAFLWLNWRWLRVAVQGLNAQSDRNLWVWQLALIASMIAWFVHGLLDYFYEFAGTYILFWLIAGLAISTAVNQPVPQVQEA
jgi:hypothetical protein